MALPDSTYPSLALRARKVFRPGEESQIEPCEAMMTQTGKSAESLQIQLGKFSINVVFAPSPEKASDPELT